MGQLPETHKCHEWVTLQQTIIICKNTLIKKSHRATSAHKCSEVSEILPKNNFLQKFATKMEEMKPEKKNKLESIIIHRNSNKNWPKIRTSP